MGWCTHRISVPWSERPAWKKTLDAYRERVEAA
jgi:hypothetical protein